MTRHQIRRGLFGDHKPAATVASKLELLQHLGLARSKAEPTTGGRPAERWFSSVPCVKSELGVGSPPDTVPCPVDALATVESRPAAPAAKGTPRAAMVGPLILTECHGASLDGHWLPAVARWPVAWRYRWEERAAAQEAAGLPRNLAELRAYREVVEEIAAV
jgi:hypothetical protein